MEEFVAIPAITVLCYLLGEGYKSFLNKELHKHIPVICGLFGCVLGVVCYLTIPGYIPADNGVVAAAMGTVSGLAATGVNQFIKQEKEG